MNKFKISYLVKKYGHKNLQRQVVVIEAINRNEAIEVFNKTVPLEMFLKLEVVC